MKSFAVPTTRTKLVVDMAGYDGFPALAALEVPLSLKKHVAINLTLNDNDLLHVMLFELLWGAVIDDNNPSSVFLNVIGNEIKHIKKTWRNSATPRKLCVPHCHWMRVGRIWSIVFRTLSTKIVGVVVWCYLPFRNLMYFFKRWKMGRTTIKRKPLG